MLPPHFFNFFSHLILFSYLPAPHFVWRSRQGQRATPSRRNPRTYLKVSFVADSFCLPLTLAPHNTKCCCFFLAWNKLQRETKKKKNENKWKLFIKMHKTCGKYFNNFRKETCNFLNFLKFFPLCRGSSELGMG